MPRAKSDQPKRTWPRINLAFYDDHLKFVQYASWKNHQSITQYINSLIAKDMNNYARAEWDQPENAR